MSRRRGDDGFVLLESIVAISLITVIMTALASFFLNAMASTSQQRARQTATQIATSAVETVRGLHTSDVVADRDATSVATQFGAASTTVQPWLTSMDPAKDLTAPAGSGATATIPTGAVHQTLNNIDYSVNDYLGTCGIPTNNSTTDCIQASAQTSAVTQYVRAVVAVSWRDSHCLLSTCNYITSTLLSTADDPTFNLNQTPPPLPIVVNPGAQNSVVGDTVALTLAVQANTGVPTYTWQITAGGLPPGLALNPAGQVTGSPTTAVTNTPVTVIVTDAFLRTASASFTWTVQPPLVIANTASQASTTGTAITPLTLTATGGTGTPYTWSALNLPPGLAIATVSNQGRVTGTPTTPGTFSVQFTVKDSSTTRSSTITVAWTIAYPPLAAANPGPQSSTVGTAISSLQLTTTGGSGSTVWSGGGSLPAGLSMNSAGLITGTPTTTGTSAVSLTVTDATAGATRTIAFTWEVIVKPTIVPPGNQTNTVGAAVNLALTTNCPNSPCTYALNNGPATLSINGSGVITGTITSAAQTFGAVTIRATDSAGGTTTSGTFTWTVNPAPTINPGNQTVVAGTAVSLNLATLVGGGTGTLTYSALGLPSWLTLNTTTGVISGTAPSTVGTTTGITVKARDSQGISGTSPAFSWQVTAGLTVAVPDQVTALKGAVNLNLNNLTTGGVGPYTFTASGLPSYVSLDGATGLMTGTGPNGPKSTSTTSNITVTVTDRTGATATSASFRWFLTDLAWTTIPNKSSTRAATSLDVTPYRSGGNTPYTYSATGLPAGLTINSSTGVISGTPTTVATYSVKVTVTDSAGAAVISPAFTWQIT